MVLAWLAIGGLLAMTAPGEVPRHDCAALAGAALAPGLTVNSAVAVPADAGRRLPAYCEVRADASAAAGSHIGLVFRLPLRWNGKILGLGGGGWAGNVKLETAAPSLAKGYATLQTDTGHPSPDPGDAAWAVVAPGKPDQAAVTDFSWRAVHVMTQTGKAVVKAYYGAPQSRTYFQGCSTGGRQGLMEAQRFPEDYDGVIAGAPVYTLVVQTSALLRTQMFHNDPQSNLLPEQLTLINRAVLAACDRDDGVADGVVSDPGACRWDPGVLQCKGSAGPPRCLTAKQTATVRAAYAGVRTAKGEVAAYPLSRGGELGWLDRSVGTPQAPLGSNAVTGSRGIQYLVYADRGFDAKAWNPQTGLAEVEGGRFARDYEAKDPDIGQFADRGGKLILWHGGYDPGPSPIGSTAYYDAVRRTIGGAKADRSLRFFVAPGVYHCGGGPGPDQFDMVDVLDRWVVRGEAPGKVIASSKADDVSRPLCAYPAAARYGGGDPAKAASFSCAAPKAH
jgi:feruloyl esterase